MYNDVKVVSDAYDRCAELYNRNVSERVYDSVIEHVAIVEYVCNF